MKNLLNVKALSELNEWCTIVEISRACGIKDYRLKRNLQNVRTMKLGDLPNCNLLYYVPDVITFLESKIKY